MISPRVCVCVMSVTALVSARKVCVCECVQTSVCTLSVCCQLSNWELLFQINNKRLFPKCSLSADTLLFLLNEAKPVAQRQRVNKRGNTKKDLSTHVSGTISRGVRSRERWEGRRERKSTTVNREGKRSHSRYFVISSQPDGYYGLERSSGCVPCGRCYGDPVQMATSLSPLCLQQQHCWDCDRRTA